MISIAASHFWPELIFSKGICGIYWLYLFGLIIPLSAFTLALNKGSFATFLANEGLIGTKTVKNEKKSIPLFAVFNKTIFERTAAVTYSATRNKLGEATGK